MNQFAIFINTRAIKIYNMSQKLYFYSWLNSVLIDGVTISVGWQLWISGCRCLMQNNDWHRTQSYLFIVTKRLLQNLQLSWAYSYGYAFNILGFSLACSHSWSLVVLCSEQNWINSIYTLCPHYLHLNVMNTNYLQ